MNTHTELISARREDVLQSYNSAKASNRRTFLEGDDKATAEYIFPNQIEDANNIVNKFYHNKRRVISVQKKTKIGADGLIIEISKLMTTHIDDCFVVNPKHVKILTGMSNSGWEKDMKDKAPSCFKDSIFHHGKLSRSELSSVRNGLFIIDEIDSGNGEGMRLHTTLKEAGILDVKHMEENNNRFIFISATMIKELYDLYRWGDLHELYKMTIPPSYIGHKEFLDLGIIQEFYAMDTIESATRWIQEDIIDKYGSNYRVHIARVQHKTVDMVQNACISKSIAFRNHTSMDRLLPQDIDEFFRTPLKQHIVLLVKGLLRRANLLPNAWKLCIGATHEYYTKKVDNNVQIQGLPGRMSGYWRNHIEAGYVTGPHRTSIKAIQEYEKIYLDPFGCNPYNAAGFKKTKEGKVKAKSTMLSSHNIANLNPVDLPSASSVDSNQEDFESDHKICRTEYELIQFGKTKDIPLKHIEYKKTDTGFKLCTLGAVVGAVHSLEDVKKFITNPDRKKGSNLPKSLAKLEVGKFTKRRFVCYEDVNDTSSEQFVLLWTKRLR